MGVFKITQHMRCAMIGQIAIAITLTRFDDLGCLVTSIFLLMDYFLYRLYTLSEKMKKIYRLEVQLIFCKMHHRIPLILAVERISSTS